MNESNILRELFKIKNECPAPKAINEICPEGKRNVCVFAVGDFCAGSYTATPDKYRFVNVDGSLLKNAENFEQKITDAIGSSNMIFVVFKAENVAVCAAVERIVELAKAQGLAAIIFIIHPWNFEEAAQKKRTAESEQALSQEADWVINVEPDFFASRSDAKNTFSEIFKDIFKQIDKRIVGIIDDNRIAKQ